MKIISMIPARYAATRFPGKLMQDLGGKTVILRTYEATVETKLFDDVFVVTDNDIIYNEIVNNGGKAIMSIKEHECGSDRIAEAVESLDIDIVINVQGDEPFIDEISLFKLIEVFKNDSKHYTLQVIYKNEIKGVRINKKTTKLDFTYNNITTIDVSQNPNLEELIGYNNSLSSIRKKPLIDVI